MVVWQFEIFLNQLQIVSEYMKHISKSIGNNQLTSPISEQGIYHCAGYPFCYYQLVFQTAAHTRKIVLLAFGKRFIVNPKNKTKYSYTIALIVANSS